MDISPAEWGVTIAIVVGLIGFDLWKHRKPHDTTLREALIGTLAWTAVGLAFGVVVFLFHDATAMGEYFTGYLLERTLSLDNAFVFVLILSYFAVPKAVQHQALMFGIIVALVLRGIFIYLGAKALEHFEWTIYVFGVFLIYTAIKLAFSSDEEVDPSKNVALKILRKIAPVSNEYDGQKLFTKVAGSTKRVVTPLFAVLLVLGTTDLVFAVDSIPAIFGALKEPEPYIVFAANAFALLGLLPMTFLIAGSVERFKYLKHALALVLGLVGAKMLVSDIWHPNTFAFLAVVVAVLAGGIAFSLFKTRNDPPHADPLHENIQH